MKSRPAFKKKTYFINSARGNSMFFFTIVITHTHTQVCNTHACTDRNYSNNTWRDVRVRGLPLYSLAVYNPNKLSFFSAPSRHCSMAATLSPLF